MYTQCHVAAVYKKVVPSNVIFSLVLSAWQSSSSMSLSHTSQLVPNSMCGAILGFAAWAPKNDNAISVSFGDSGYTTTLARVFKWVRFNHNYYCVANSAYIYAKTGVY